MPTIIEGQRSTEDILQIRRVVDISDKIYLLNPNAAPLTVLTSKLSKKETVNPRYDWMEDDIMPYWDAINCVAGYAADATLFVVDNGAYFRVGDLWKVPRTGEVFLVRTKTVVADNTLNLVERGVGSSAKAALVNDEPLMKLASAEEEGAGSPAAKSTLEVDKYNFTQIIKTSFEVTGTEDASKLHGGKDRNSQRNKKGIEHLIDIERQFWFGERGYDDNGTHRKRFTGGVLEYVKTNVEDAGGLLTEVEFENFLRKAFKYGSSTKWGFCSPLVASVINLWAAGRLQTVPGEKTYGVAVSKYMSIHGILNLVMNKLFEGVIYGGYMAVLDMEEIDYRNMSGRDTKLETNIQNNDVDGFKDQYKSEVGLEIRQEKKHAILTGVSG